MIENKEEIGVYQWVRETLAQRHGASGKAK